jgi:hypothetical protein
MAERRPNPIGDAMKARYPARWTWYKGLIVATFVAILASPFTIGITLLVAVPTLVAALIVYMPMRQHRRQVIAAYLAERGLSSMRELARQPWLNTLSVEQFRDTGATARVESAGEIHQRVTLTRAAAVGIFAVALPKKTDARTLFLTIEGPGVAEVREYRKNRVDELALRQFAARINSLSLAA